MKYLLILLLPCLAWAGDLGYGDRTDTLTNQTVVKHCFSYAIPCPEGRPGCLVYHCKDSCWYEVVQPPDTIWRDTIPALNWVWKVYEPVTEPDSIIEYQHLTKADWRILREMIEWFKNRYQPKEAGIICD